MPNPLNNVSTSNAYTEACSFSTYPVDSVFVQVYNAAVYYRITVVVDGIAQSQYPEKFLAPGKGTFTAPDDWRANEKLVKIEFRSAATGVPASVTANAA